MTRRGANARYENIMHLGEGQFANVYKAKDLETGDIVAVKKIKLSSRYDLKDGVNRTAVREIKLLQEVHHENVISLRDVIGHKTSIQLVFDFMDTDLERLIQDNRTILMPTHIKNLVLQMLLGIEYLHSLWILHRDLKPNNLLLNSSGRLKVSDFGLARFYGSPNRNYTSQVVTRWYRSPELLFGARAYGTGVDIWSVGCIIAELLLRVPFFPGESDLDQLAKIFDLLGAPKAEEWPDMYSLDNYIAFKESDKQGIPLKSIFTAANDDLILLISKCLKYNPLQRWTATDALKSQYFSTMPYACLDSELPLPATKDNSV